MRVLDIAVTENAKPIPIEVLHPSPLIAVGTGRRRRGQTTTFDLPAAPVVGRWARSTTCAT